MGTRFSELPAAVQIILLFLMAAASYFLFAAAAVLALQRFYGTGFADYTPALLIIQLSGLLGCFLLPALCLYRLMDWPRVRFSFSFRILLIFLLVYAALYFPVEWWEKWSATWNLGKSESAWLRRFDAQSKAAEALVQKMLHPGNTPVYVFALLVIGPCAAFCEEFFFRGGLQKLLTGKGGRIRNHVGVWVTAIIFSAAHLDLYGFVPRLLLGALLGYAYLYSGSLGLPVLLHMLNNLLAAFFI